MTIRIETYLLLGCSLAIAACGGDPAVGPRDTEPPVLGAISLLPTMQVMTRGTTLRLDVVATSQRGTRMALPSHISFDTDNRSVATVDRTGVVTAHSQGSAVITATTASYPTIRRAAMAIHVADSLSGDTLLLIQNTAGWQPDTVHLAVGSTVRWVTRVPWESPIERIYLMNDVYQVQDSVTLRDGLISRTFVRPGTIRFCSGSCWDPPQFGLIIVRLP